MTTATTGTVYALVDPRDSRVRYIGATTQTLKARLNGHTGSRTQRVKAWVDELASQGLTPQIEPIIEGVDEGDLRDAERAEITRRLVAGEQLLNESATAPARHRIERQRKVDRVERERAAWECAAHQVRSIVGGPLSPMGVPVPRLGRHFEQAYLDLMKAEDEPDREVEPDVDRRLSKETRLRFARADAADALWRSVRPVWSSLRRKVDKEFEEVLSCRVGAIFSERWTDFQDASRYLALLPWGMIAVGPWAALAERAGMDISGSAFVDWATDDPSVREALTMLLVRSGGRMGPLSVLDDFDASLRPSTGLVAITAAYHPGFDLPQELILEVRSFLESVLRGGSLTPAMADLLLELDPGALDKLLGPEITAGIDARLGLPPGTSADVLVAVLEKSGGRHLNKLADIVNRARGALPTVEAPDFSHWHGDTMPMFQAVTASLTAAGVLTATPDGKTPAELVSEVRALWCADPNMLERAA